MNYPPAGLFQQAIENARLYFSRGDRLRARFWAQRAASLAPDREEPWLWLAAVSSPRASLDYLQRALEINPASKRARQGIHWAIRRLRKSGIRLKPRQGFLPSAYALTKPITVEPALHIHLLPLALGLILLTLGLVAWTGSPSTAHLEDRQALWLGQIEIEKATPTPLPTFTPTPTPLPSPTATPTPISTETPVPTQAIIEISAPTVSASYDSLPDGIEAGERWIDVDLSEQRLYAYEGEEMVESFLVSTGTWQHPTVTGQFHIYVKYVSAPMWGPGYYLPGVPYTMYFYQGYALHGTYWHNNFGTPMSHGCVNLRTEDAGWLFEWADIGTLVNIHE